MADPRFVGFRCDPPDDFAPPIIDAGGKVICSVGNLCLAFYKCHDESVNEALRKALRWSMWQSLEYRRLGIPIPGEEDGDPTRH